MRRDDGDQGGSMVMGHHSSCTEVQMRVSKAQTLEVSGVVEWDGRNPNRVGNMAAPAACLRRRRRENLLFEGFIGRWGFGFQVFKSCNIIHAENDLFRCLIIRFKQVEID